MAYERGQPTYSMTLKFNELEPIYNTDYLGADTLDNRLDTKGNVTGDLTTVQTVNQFDSSTTDRILICKVIFLTYRFTICL